LGGGTPTFLSADALTQLLKPILSRVKIDTHDFEGSIEVDPRRTNAEQLKALRELGFNRVSMGVQDFNPEVQRLVNRIQPLEITKNLTDEARAMGYTSVNFDLIYGLAKQTPESITETAKATVALRPDRIALYSFALVPWIKPAQRLFKDEDLPKSAEKRELYEIARGILLDGGYVEVGMDHFALSTDNLCIAMNEKRLHRNFMGYTDQRTDVLLGMGVSSISETPYSFHQNEKVLPLYEAALNDGRLPTLRGHILTDEDKVRRDQILQLMTNFEVPFINDDQEAKSKEFLAEMIKDALVEVKDHKLVVKEEGRPFLRNACVFFDERLKNKQPQTKIFSQSI
jgi:oxygen-independent coproporphyrinogen-3 oxidase